MDKVKIEKFRAISDNSTNFIDLISNLERAGFNFNSNKEMFKLIAKLRTESADYYIKYNLKNFSVDIIDLPSKVVELKGTKFFLHGIIHQLFTSKRMGGFIQYCASNYTKKSSDYLVETGLDKVYGLNPSKSFNDGEVFQKFCNTPDKIDLLLKNLASARLNYAASYPAIEFQRLLGLKNMATLSFNAINDERYLLPAIETFEKGYSFSNCKLEREYFARHPNTAVCGLALPRSKWMADQLIQTAQEFELKEVHGIMGLAHVDQVEYYFSRPDLSFDTVLNSVL